jgi:hypothetical protein
LGLSGTHPSAAVVRAWAAHPAVAHLLTLRLNANKLADHGAVALANSRHLAGLRRLELRDNGINEAGAMALADSPHLDGLTVLDVTRNAIPPKAAERLRARFGAAVRLSGC